MKDLAENTVAVTDSIEKPLGSLATSDAGSSMFTLFSSIAPVFLLVIVLILLMLWVVKRIGLNKFTSNLLMVRANYSVTAKERILVVEIDKKLLVVGVTQHQMTLLHTVDEDSAKVLLIKTGQRNQLNAMNKTFSQLLQKALERGKQ